MTQKLENTDRYAATPEQMIAMMSDPEYLAAKYDALGDISADVQEQSNDGSVLRLKIARVVESSLPDLAKKFLGKTSNLAQSEEWDISGQVKTGSLVIDSPPAKITATTEIAPAGGTECDYTVKFEIKVGVPMAGGKIEKMVKSETADNLVKEKEFNDKWLAEH